MQYIKKLVILIGSGARGTLLLIKNGFGVWCELNIFDLQPRKDYKLVIISGDDTHIMDIGDGKNQRIHFELGDIGMEEIHAAIISDDVVMYGSNCAKKLSHIAVMERVHKLSKKDETSLISYSERDKSKDHINNISSPIYDDFAIAEKNYYPPQVSLEQEAASTLNDDLYAEKTERKEKAKSETASKNGEVKIAEKANHTSAVEKSEHNEDKKIKEEKRVSKIMPHELEQKFLRLMGTAGTQRGADEAASGIETVIKDKEHVEPQKKASDLGETQKLTVAEKPEVIAMARRITLRDYRVEEPKKASGRKATFFERSSAQIEKLMNSFERFSAMEKMIPGSRFVKINYDKKRYYIVGVIGRDYICYGVPSMYSSVPPEMFDGYARWLPFDADFPHGEGFWMMYQDGISGETLKS